MGQLEVTLQYAVRWYAVLNEALASIRAGKTWKAEGAQTHILKTGRIKSFYEPHDEVRDEVSKLLSRVGPYIVQCARGACGKLFVPHRKQRYCSPRCSSRTRLERFRNRTV